MGMDAWHLDELKLLGPNAQELIALLFALLEQGLP